MPTRISILQKTFTGDGHQITVEAMDNHWVLDLVERDAQSLYWQREKATDAMAAAALEVVQTLRTNPSARWGHGTLNSRRNLSRIVASAIVPVLNDIELVSGAAASAYLPHLHARSIDKDIDRTEKILARNLCPSAEGGARQALEFLLRFLAALRTPYAPSQSSAIKTGDGPYCRFCYREIWKNYATGSGDLCHVHVLAGEEYMKGRYRANRYQFLKQKLGHIFKNSEMPSQIVLRALAGEDVPPWSGRQDDTAWIELVLKALNLCRPNEAKSFAARLAERSARDANALSPKDWPLELAGTMFRYVIYQLALMRTPSHDVAKRLSRVWQGESISQVAAQTGVTRQILHRQLVDWRAKIDALRADYISDEAIQIVFGLQALPSP